MHPTTIHPHHSHVPPAHYFIAAPVEFALIVLMIMAGILILRRNLQFPTNERPALPFIPRAV